MKKGRYLCRVALSLLLGTTVAWVIPWVIVAVNPGWAKEEGPILIRASFESNYYRCRRYTASGKSLIIVGASSARRSRSGHGVGTPSWMTIPSSSAKDPAIGIATWAYGWPALSTKGYCLLSEREIGDPYVTAGFVVLRAGITPVWEWPPERDRALYMPVMPHWPGLVRNVLFWSGIAYIMMQVGTWTKYLWNCKHGQCANCGYPRFGQVCPECGIVVASTMGDRPVAR